MDKSESITELAKSLMDFQAELKPVPKESVNPFFKSKYADLSAIWESIRPLLTKHGFAISQLPRADNGQIILTTLLLHTSGQWLSSDLLVTPTKSSDPQSAGSALTYARRYALSAMLGICSEDDDDANAASSVAKTKPYSQVKAEALADTELRKEYDALAPQDFKHIGEFLTACQKNLKLTRTQVLEKLGVQTFDKVNFADAYASLQ